MNDPAEMGRTQPTSVLPDIFAGVGIGLLLGVIVSMSITPVVAGVVSALTSLLAVFLGLDGSSTGTRILKINALRIGSFGFATILGLGLGMYVRINEPLKAPPAQLHASWQAAFPDNPTLARQITLFEYSGIEPARWRFDPEGEGSRASVNSGISDRTSSVLFSTLSEYDACNRLDPDDWSNPDKLVTQFSDPKAPDLVQALGKSLTSLPESTSEAEQARAIGKAHDYLCMIQDAGG